MASAAAGDAPALHSAGSGGGRHGLLDDSVERAAEAPMENFNGLVRLVRRNDSAVDPVFLNGRRAYADGRVSPELGKSNGFGQVLRAVE